MLTEFQGVGLLWNTGISPWFQRRFASPLVAGDQLNEVRLVSRTSDKELVSYSDLLTKMASAPPLAVALDFYGLGDGNEPDDLAASLIAGIQALKAAGCPVVVGVHNPEIGPNRWPIPEELRPDIAAAATGWGDLSIYGGTGAPWRVPLVHRWGDGVPFPSLSMATVAAAWSAEEAKTLGGVPAATDPPRLRPWYFLEGSRLQVEMAPLDHPAALPIPDLDRKRVISTTLQTVPESWEPIPRSDRPNELPEAAVIAVPMPPMPAFGPSTLSIRQVMDDPGKAQGKVVVVCDLVTDVHDSAYGQIPGAYGHAVAIAAVRSGCVTRWPGPLGEWVIPLAGAAAGLAFPLPIVRRRSWWPRWAIGGAALVWAVMLLGALTAGVVAAWWFGYLFDPLIVVFAMLATALLLVVVDRLRRQYPVLQARGVR
jgi:hypothetical protein